MLKVEVRQEDLSGLITWLEQDKEIKVTSLNIEMVHGDIIKTNDRRFSSIQFTECYLSRRGNSVFHVSALIKTCITCQMSALKHHGTAVMVLT